MGFDNDSAPEGLLGPYSHVQCVEACMNNEMAYSQFKRDRKYNEILEHVSAEQGIQYLRCTQEQFPQLFNQIDWLQIQQSDRIGNPVRHNYQDFLTGANLKDYEFSPSIFRYVYFGLLILQHLKKANLFTPRIVEIGGGYGGQLYIINILADLFGIEIAEYLLVDLNSVVRHQEKYLNDMGVSNFQPCSFENVRDNIYDFKSHDLLVSNYALGEFSENIQNMYIEKVVKKCKHCFVVWNTPQINAYFTSPNFYICDEKPQTNGGVNKLIVDVL